jgi:hypothetical protein
MYKQDSDNASLLMTFLLAEISTAILAIKRARALFDW